MRGLHLYLTLLISTIVSGADEDPRPKAVVYRGPAACEGCPEAVASLLRSSSPGYDVEFVGPKEKSDVTPEALKDIDLYAQPGGGELLPAWRQTRKYKKTIREYVDNGGKYAGFCAGAYLAGSTPGFALLPKGCDTAAESTMVKAQVESTNDTMIQVNWKFQTGPQKGKVDRRRWMYFQDGTVILLSKIESDTVLGRYSSNGDIAASITPFGKGWVGLAGPHPEADKSWYQAYNLTNPDGIRFDLGHDFVQSLQQRGISPSSIRPERVLLTLLVSLTVFHLTLL